jgi:hypothetical protein
VYALFRWTVGLASALHMAGAIGLTTLLSFLSFHLLENPLRRSHFVMAQPKWRVVASGLAVVFLCWGLTRKIFAEQPRYSLSVTKDASIWQPWPPRPSFPSDPCRTEVVHRQSDGAIISTFKRMPCGSSPLRSHRVFVVGDSHAIAYGMLLRQLTDEQGVEVRLYSKAGCFIANLLRPMSSRESQCGQFVQMVTADIQHQAAPDDVVWLASLRMNRFCGQWATCDEARIVAEQKNSEEARQDQSLALQETIAILDTLEKVKVHVMIDAPKPIFKSPPFRCSDWFNAHNPICQSGLTVERTMLLEYRKPVMDSLASLVVAYPKLVIWDPFFVLCPADICSAFDRGKPLFYDGDHLSAYGNRMLYPSFFSLLTKIWETDGQ